MGKKVLVTGATGFIGSHLVERLVCLGAEVTAMGAGLGWRPVVRDLVRQGRVRFVNQPRFWGPALLQRLQLEFEGVVYVVHLGYEMPHGRTALEKALDDGVRNVFGTLQLVQQLPPSVSKICFASSVSVYGYRDRQPVKETDPLCPSTIYAIGKLATEKYLLQHAIDSGVSLTILRYATVYGPMETVPRAIPNFIRQVLHGIPPVVNGDGEDRRDYVHVQDVVQATVNALVLDSENAQICNVGSGMGHTTREIAERVIRMLGEHMHPRFKSEERASAGIICDIAQAYSTLAYKPCVDLAEGLRGEIEWFHRHPQFWRHA
jgi:UDP-glucose 4-epimerase